MKWNARTGQVKQRRSAGDAPAGASALERREPPGSPPSGHRVSSCAASTYSLTPFLPVTTCASGNDAGLALQVVARHRVRGASGATRIWRGVGVAMVADMREEVGWLAFSLRPGKRNTPGGGAFFFLQILTLIATSITLTSIYIILPVNYCSLHPKIVCQIFCKTENLAEKNLSSYTYFKTERVYRITFKLNCKNVLYLVTEVVLYYISFNAT